MAPKKIKFENVSSSSNSTNTVSDSSNESYKTDNYKVDKYKSLSQIEHILTLPDTYIGSIERYSKDGLIYDYENKRIVYKKITQPEGLERIYLEIISNAGDNVQRSRESDVNPGNIVVNFTDSTVEVINGGNMIPIEKNIDGIWIPDLIFGTLLTSSNYDQNEKKKVCGRNGLGSKLCNVWGKSFSIKIQNANQGKEYFQEWKNNMSEKTEPVIKNYNRKTNVMIVKFEPDFQRIYKNDPENLNSFTKEDIQIFMKHCIDMSFSCNVKVMINAKCPKLQIDYTETFNAGILNYIKHIFPDDKNIVYQNDFMECAIIDVSEEVVHEKLLNISFVNGIITKSGTHINALSNKVANCIIEAISNFNLVKDAEKVLPKLKPRDIISNVCIISSFRLVNPKFSSQTKENLTSAIPTINIKSEYFNSIKKWKLIGHILNTIENKLEKEISKTDGKKRKHVKIESAEDANWAGSSRSKECILYLIEGDSAMSYAIKYISYTKNGRNTQGCLPLKGKPLNAINATVSHIASNQVFSNIKTMLGLREGLNYKEEDNFNTLRYGKVIILTDADNDGKHIAGLVLVYFYKRYPTLLERNDFVVYLRTPIIRANKGHDLKIFYTDRSVNFNELKGYRIRYFKGLGSSTDQDIKHDVEQAKFIEMNMDDNAEQSLLLTFDEENSNDRKIKMKEFLNSEEKIEIDNINPYPISTFVKEEVIEYSIENLLRAIPSLIDGLKDAQRKALYGGFKKFTKNSAPIKVAQFAGMIASITDYKHGEKSMEDTIIGMAESYTGSNNLAYFSENGQFGCVEPNTKIITWFGNIKLAKDINENDILIGDDGLQRKISKIVKGYDDMFMISQFNNDDYIVNSEHILTLKFINHKKIYENKDNYCIEFFDKNIKKINYKYFFINNDNNQSKEYAKKSLDIFSKTIDDDDIVDINIKYLLSLHIEKQKLFKSVFNQNIIKWKKQNTKLDPYIYGKNIAKNNHVFILEKEYIINDEETRLKLLAGIIDEIGILCMKNTKYENYLINLENNLSNIEFICKSLGYYTLKNTKEKFIKIYGNLSIIPVLNIDKKSSCRKYEYNYNDITIKHVGKGEYVGWYLDSNERFLLGDFTVTHNTRNLLGEDCASSRYIYTNLRNWVYDCYIEQDFDILENIYTNGEECEYKYFLPIIPMHLINGAIGIATGYSTNIPQYSPYDIIKWLIHRIKKQSKLDNEIKIKPWYAGFKGEVTLNNDETKFTTKGILKRSRDSWIVEEIPISKSIHKYKNFLDDLLEQKEIQDYSNLSQPNSPFFVIKSNNVIDDKKLNLTSNHSLKNLVLIDKDNKPIVYQNVHDMLEDWYNFRIKKYEERKQNEINKMKSQIEKLNMKIKFIDLVLKEEILIFKQKKDKILESMKKYKLDEELLKMSMLNFTQDEIDNLIKLKNEKQDFLDKYILTTVEQIWMLELSNLLQSINNYYNTVFDSKIIENIALVENKTSLNLKKRK